jgi:hypothetical protein
MKNHSMHKTFWLLALLVAAFMPSAHAHEKQWPSSCDGTTIKAVAAWAEVKGKAITEACTAMPNAPGTMIAAITFDFSHDEARAVDDGNYLHVYALVKASKVVAAYRFTAEDNAVSYRIDTARYVLSKDIRAFGIVVRYNVNSRPGCLDANDGGEILTLWIREGEKLRPVFGINLDGWIRIEGEPCAPRKSESARMTISTEKTASHGFADLAITAHVTQELCVDHEDCSVTEKRTARKIVKYDGKSYGSEYSSRFWWSQEVLQRGKTEAE